MTSLQAIGPAKNLIYTYVIPDLRKPITTTPTEPNTLIGLLKHNKDFSRFYYMTELAGLHDKFNSPVANLTLFVPSDIYLEEKYPEMLFVNMDRYTAREIVLYHTLNKRITYDMLLSQKAMKLSTMVDKEIFAHILCENIGNGTIFILIQY